MRAAILRGGQIVVDDIDELRPAQGQVLVETIACGICGSDLHTVDHSHLLAETSREIGMSVFDFDPDQDMVMGHEMSVRVLESGPGVENMKAGTVMAARPSLILPDGTPVTPGFDNVYPGGYSQQMLLNPEALVPVPNGLDPAMAALTEPMAVGLHAVNESDAGPGRVAIVIGAGPVGLAVIAALRIKGVEPIISSDYSATRRAMATAMGAHVTLDPGQAPDRQAGFDQAVEGWARGGSEDEPPIIFDAVGVPGMIETIMCGAPSRSEIVVVGLCMENDSFRPMLGIFKRLTVKFVLGWTAEDFNQSLLHLAEGDISGETLVTGQVDLDGVPDAFRDLADPEEHVKILVRPNGR
ncbi:MAG: zinc-binding dehydrogenase [Acidimicrobiales bacterium]